MPSLRSKLPARGIAGVAAGLLILGCATTESLEPGEGISFPVQGRSYDDIWKTATTVVSRGLFIVDYDYGKGVIRAETRRPLVSTGGMVAVFVKPPGGGGAEYTVEVVGLNKYGVQIAGGEREETIAREIQAGLHLEPTPTPPPPR